MKGDQDRSLRLAALVGYRLVEAPLIPFAELEAYREKWAASVEPVTAAEMAVGLAVRDGNRAVPLREFYMGKPILCVDWDGVVHSYSSGWQGADVVGDPLVPGAIAFLLGALNHFDVCIYSSRSSQRGGVRAMRDALKREAGNCWYDLPAGPGLENVRFPEQKPAAFLTIDDRAICFDGDWSKLDPQALLAFKPWNKQ